MIKEGCKNLVRLQILYLSPFAVSCNAIPQLIKGAKKQDGRETVGSNEEKARDENKNYPSTYTSRTESERVWMPKLKIKLNINTSFFLLKCLFQKLSSLFLNKHTKLNCARASIFLNLTLQLNVQYDYTHNFKRN